MATDLSTRPGIPWSVNHLAAHINVHSRNTLQSTIWNGNQICAACDASTTTFMKLSPDNKLLAM